MIGEHESTARMGKVWLLGDPRRLVLATDIPENKTRWQTEHFRCEFCPAKVYPRFTPRTETSSGRRPHFARNPSSDANPNFHANECIYNVERIVDELIEMSEEQLERPKRGRPKYRLPWPQTFQRQDPRSPLDPPEQDVERIAYQRKLRPLLNTAAKIADLLTEYRQSGSDPGVEFEASCQGHTVDWMNFLYTPNRAWVLAQRLRRTGPLDHPVAVLFKNGPIRSAKPDWSFLEDRIPVPKGHDVKGEKLFVGGDPRALAAALPADSTATFYIGYGVWTLSPPSPPFPGRLSLSMAKLC